jgi:hypothetical protein
MYNRKFYTDGIEVIRIIHKSESGYLVKDQDDKVLLLNNINSYRLLDDKRNIKDWYNDSKAFMKEHPWAAVSTAIGVFFGLTAF